ncbi:MAG TPA: outer membrane beta-barrel family protein [Ignavibacteriaceae bacterium]|nr:outer membrane beta-barrel family protein [Ignavibacteriaceae bacterium]
MHKIVFIVLLKFIIISENNFSQIRSNQPLSGGSISGRVLESGTGKPIEYSNIVVLSVSDTTLVTGGITNSDGYFNLTQIPEGAYFLDVRFIGFEDKRFEVTLTSRQMNLDMGEIVISATEIDIEEVIVEGQRSPVSYQIDKKVIDVEQMQTVISGNAVDILENIPSVTVDIDGNVSLRGSGSFTVLIDGRPSVLDAQDILQQIPASSIGSIEIITNPSAKYDPEGTAGIINIVLKESRLLGFSGIVNANAGLNDKYGGDFLVEYVENKFSSHFGFDYNRRFSPGDRRQENRFILDQNTNFINSLGDRERGRISYSARAGMEFRPGQSNILSFGGRIGFRESIDNALLNYVQWSQNDPQQFNYLSRSERSRASTFFALNSNFIHKFNSKGHELSTELVFSSNEADEFTRSSEINNNTQFDGKWTTEKGPSSDVRGKVDYVLPIGNNSKFESGYQGQIDISEESTSLLNYSSTMGIYEIQPEFSYTTEYTRSEHALYSIFSNSWNKFGLQAGLRGEYTFRTIELPLLDQEYRINRWDYFPSVHGSYEFSKGNQVMASYTRRIERPRGWQLEPFDTWMDANNVRRGNPALEPEYIDSYEMAVQTYFGNISLSAEVYYKMTQNKIEGVRSVFADDVTLNTVENIGRDYSIGSEVMLLFDVFKFWNVNLMGNIYNYKIEGVLYEEQFSRESFNWQGRLNNVFRLGGTTQLQVNARYNSPSVSSQGRREGYFSTDLALRQDIFDRLLSVTLQVRDVLGTAKYEFTSEGLNFYNYNYFTRESPVVMLNLRLNINTQRNEREGTNENGNFNGEDF